MLTAGLLFDLGVVLMAAAQNFAMLIIGRILLGVAVAFASVAVTLYNSEMAPAHMRGRLNQIFQARPLAISPQADWHSFSYLFYPLAKGKWLCSHMVIHLHKPLVLILQSAVSMCVVQSGKKKQLISQLILSRREKDQETHYRPSKPPMSCPTKHYMLLEAGV